jgi:DNA invertase Pin-like site-specific DNA recombinase
MKPPAKPLSTFGYIRVSTDRQDLSVDAQENFIRTYAEHKGLPAPQIETDADWSGRVELAGRPGGKALLTAIEQECATHEVHLIVPKLTRFGRNTVDVSLNAERLNRWGVTLHFLDLNVDTRTPMGRAFMQIAAVFAELEVAFTTERIRDALNVKKSRNEVCGQPCFGWDAVPNGKTTRTGVAIRVHVDNPVEQAWLLKMKHWREVEGLSYKRIADRLNAAGVPTKQSGALITQRGSIKAGLPSQKFCAGKWQQGQVAKLLAPPIEGTRYNHRVQEWFASLSERGAA